MIKRTLKQIHEMAGGLNSIESFGDRIIEGVTIDSRKVVPGNLFVPLPGAHADGHLYAESAFSKGAAASFWQKDVPNPPEGLPVIVVENVEKALQRLAESYRAQLDVKVVGITGSNGKTTTKDITAALLSTIYKVCKTQGNFNNHLGLPLTILSMDDDTQAAVLEMGMSSRGEIDFLSRLGRPDVAVITNIGESHLLDLGSREEIANAKLEITAGLKKGGTLIYHGDEPLLQERIDGNYSALRLLPFGRNENSSLYPVSIEQTENASVFKVDGVIQGEFTLPVLGNHNVMNALAAILAARELGVGEEQIAEGLRMVQLTNMRMELVEGARGEKIFNDAYNASPTSVKAAVELIEGLSGFKRKLLVVGDMLELGPQEKNFHAKIGELINPQEIDEVFTFGPLSQYIAEGAVKRFGPDRVHAFLDKEQLIQELTSFTGEGDLILVKASRGMKLEEVVAALQKK